MKTKTTLTNFLNKSLGNLHIAIGFLIGTEDIETNAQYIQISNNEILRVNNTTKQEIKLRGSNMTIKEIREKLNKISFELTDLLVSIDIEEDNRRLHTQENNVIKLSPKRLPFEQRVEIKVNELLNKGGNNDN